MSLNYRAQLAAWGWTCYIVFSSRRSPSREATKAILELETLSVGEKSRTRSHALRRS